MEYVYKYKMHNNIKYELNDFGMIKAESILNELIKYPEITRKKDNVILRLDNMQIYGRTIFKGEYDMLNNIVILYTKEEN